MIKKISLAISVATVISVGGMPTAIAQTNSPEAGIPYEITFDGSHYPANLETVEYPYTAASRQLDGECQLNVMADSSDNLVGITILSCTDDLFRNAAARYISNQVFAETATTGLTAHPLSINWDIGTELGSLETYQLATR